MLRSGDPADREAVMARLKIGALGGASTAAAGATGFAAHRRARGLGPLKRAGLAGAAGLAGGGVTGGALASGLGPGASLRRILDEGEGG